MPLFEAGQLLEFVTGVTAAMGGPLDEARLVAGHLVGANLAGHDSHGVIRLKQYHQHVRQGRILPGSSPLVVREGPSVAVIDGNRAWGQVVAATATELAVRKARATSIAAVCVRNSYHVGRVGVYPQLAARQGFIAQVFCNGHGMVRVAPWGGREPRLATNPLAVAIPTGGEPIVVDITTSVVAEGKIRLARNAGATVPEGWVLDRDGRPSTDPASLYAGGSLLPLGGREGYKGYALSLVVDLLGGVLSGAGAGLLTSEIGNGLFIQVTDPEAFIERARFERKVQEFIDYVRSSARQPGVEEILLPGEPELRAEARRRRDGIEIDGATWEEVAAVARAVGIEPPGAGRLTA